MNTYWLLIPVHNEEKNINSCLDSIRHRFPTLPILVIDDGSEDNTHHILLQRKDIEILTMIHNHGKGFAMRKGARYAFQRGAKAVIFMDGDNQHNPQHIENFISHLDKNADVIVGVRLLKVRIPFFRKLGNEIMIWLMNIFFGIKLHDMMCGFRALSKKGFHEIEWESNGYEVEIEMLTILGRKRIPFKTVVVDTIYHDDYKGFSILDGMRLILQLPYLFVKRIN